MIAEDILKLYDAEMRISPPESPGSTHDHHNDIVRTTGEYNLIGYHRFPSSVAKQRITNELAFFANYPGELEWKIHGHDEPEGLGRHLADAGFVADDPETLMIFDLNSMELPMPFIDGLEIRWVRDRSSLRQMIDTADRSFSEASSLAAYENRLSDETVALCVGYLGATPVGTGRLDLPYGRSFAGIYAGSVLPEYRRKGIYRAIVAARAKHAKQKGFRYLYTEARETSRPILERLGFTPLTSVQGWRVSI